MGIRLIASDLDGTLLNHDKQITPFTRAALEKAAAQGILFVPATGRAYGSVPEEIRTLPGAKYLITSNGAAIYSISGKERIYQCLMAEKSVEEILALPIGEEVAMEGFVQGIPYSDGRYVEDPGAFGASGFGIGYVKRTRRAVEDIRGFLYDNRKYLDSMAFVCKVPEIREELRRNLASKVSQLYITSSVPHLVEVGHSQGGKGQTLLQLLKLLGISPREAIAFGDADNDQEMLSAVAYGIAMGNATKACREAACYVTDTNEQDGVGKAILSFARLS